MNTVPRDAIKTVKIEVVNERNQREVVDVKVAVLVEVSIAALIQLGVRIERSNGIQVYDAICKAKWPVCVEHPALPGALGRLDVNKLVFDQLFK